MRTILVFLITLYRYTISPLLGPCCRFHPSCSEYAKEAIERHGAFNGLRLTVRRLLRCHPFHHGGYDPVPTDLETMREAGCGIQDLRNRLTLNPNRTPAPGRTRNPDRTRNPNRNPAPSCSLRGSMSGLGSD